MGLIAHYRLDGDATDSVGGKHGTVDGGVSWVDGKIGQCGNFDQTKISVDKPIPTNGSPFSISVWINPFSAMGSTHSSFINDGASRWDNGFTMYVRQSPGADLNINFVTEDGRRFQGVGGTFNYDRFNHVVYTFDGKNGRTYVNGELAVVQGESLGTYNGGDLQIGRGVLGYWKGLIDDVRIYDHALSPREVRDLSLGLAADYRLNGDLTDAAGGNHSPSTGVSYSEGPAGKSIDLTHGSVNFPVTTGNTFSLSLWVKLNSDYTGSYRKFLQQGIDRSPGFWFWKTSNRLHLRSRLSITTNAGADTHTSLLVGEWYHLVYQVEEGSSGTTIRSYLNGEIEAQDSYPGETVVVSGSSVELLGQDCEVAELKLYNSMLTAAQVKEVYQQRASIDSEGNLYVS